MTAKECITTRRSIRSFKEEPVSDSVIESIVATASMAPSWKNTQIVRYIAVSGETKEKLAACTKSFSGNGAIMSNAPTVVAIVIKKGRCGFERDGSYTTPRKDSWQMFDAGVAAQTFCLAAWEQGIGSVIMGIFDIEEAKKVLEITDEYDLISLIPIGYPNVSPEAPKRKEVSELLSFKK
ncbi:MAG: nitroreductase family protein [Lachnospiraceae bacterium]|nr:nitroreductase family protein [Lachnospiraceae bacterium]